MADRGLETHGVDNTCGCVVGLNNGTGMTVEGMINAVKMKLLICTVYKILFVPHRELFCALKTNR